MQPASVDPRMPEPSPENPGTAAAFQSSPLNVGTLHTFAQNMAENIIQAFVSQMEKPELDCRESSSNQDQEMLADELASAVIAVALTEASRGRNVDDLQHSQKAFQSSGSLPSPRREDGMDGQAGKLFSDGSLDMDPDPSPVTQACYPPLPQSGLPVLGSLDYPDPPPTTPLLPELVRSRDSFLRKLKGGLAKEFLPSPPPPTPKDKLDVEAPTGDPGAEFMEDLMRSLSTGCAEGGEAGWRDDFARAVDLCGGGDDPVGPHGAKMMAFAEALTADIINRVSEHYASILNARNEEEIDDDGDVHRLAHRLADTIITSSLDEVEMLL